MTNSNRTMLISTPSMNTRRTVLAGFAGLLTVGVSRQVWVEESRWTLLVNSQVLPLKIESLIKQLQTNPGGFAFNYALVVGQSLQAKQMNRFMSQHGLQLEEITFKNWTQAHHALSKGLVDLMFTPAQFKQS